MLKAIKVTEGEWRVIAPSWELIFRDVGERGRIWVSWERIHDCAPRQPTKTIVANALAEIAKLGAVALPKAA